MAGIIAATAVPITAASASPDAGDLGTASDYGAASPTDEGDLTSPTGAWFVQLEAAPTARGGTVAATASDQQAFLDEAADLGVEVDVRNTYSTLWNGLSVAVSDDDAATLAEEADSVVAVFPVLLYEIPEDQNSPVPDLASALSQSGADIAQSELGFTGEGLRVGVMDTGVDIDHPDFGGSGVPGETSFPTERIAYGYDLVGDSYNADPSDPAYQPVPQPDGNPDDCEGHGTHVAGIVGANGDLANDGVRGVAPDATLGAYRVFGCAGSTTADVMIEAMELALADGMDVLNMSIGSALATWPEYPTAVASDNLVDAGVVVVASIGNEGDLGTWAAGAPGVGDKVIGVASYDNTQITANAVAVGDHLAGYTPATGSPEAPTSGSLPLVALGEPGTDEARACTPIEADLTGSAVLVERGLGPNTPECDASFYNKALTAQNAGAAAVLIYNNVPGLLNATVEGAEPITIPVIFIGAEDGQAYTAAALAGPVDLTWTDQTTTAPNPTGGLISSFSSYGMTADLQIKPDIGAPGGSIWSTVPLEQGGHASNSGTSMSSPHVAGAVALYLQAHPGTTPSAVRDVLQNNADPALWSLNTGVGALEPVHRQGAGMLDIDDAILTETLVSPGKLSLGESEAGPVTRTLTVTNTGADELTYDLTFEDAVSTGGAPYNPSFYWAESTVDMPASVTVPAGGSVEIDVSITPSADLELAQYGGYISLTAGAAQPIRVPYAGFAGDYQALPLMLTEGSAFPALAALTECSVLEGPDCLAGGSWDLAEEGQVYSMADGDVPTTLVNLAHPARSVQVDIYHANADGSRGDPAGVNPTYQVHDYLGRSVNPNDFSAFTWDGTLTGPGHGRGGDRVQTLPDGNYVMEITALAALGDEANPDHVESFTSPAFTVDRDGDGNPPPVDPPGPPSIGDLLKLLAQLLAALLKCILFGIC
ncbi:S8 family serine peptidase [Occultella glacieicola]|uniref:S8 family serine peptidase n=1 Tax=Occultella glacieicola TaxID=2518684 RepID=UPI002E2602D3|nr:S8 family serine peptidase [Occultella glacieicola]